MKTTICRVCRSHTSHIFTNKVLKKHTVNYFFCSYCKFLQTEEPHWLKEAYERPINLSDTGIMNRNINFSKLTATLLYNFFSNDSKGIDYAGGYGIFTRLMRDIGFDFYWQDKYTTNLLAQGFEDDASQNFDILTAFEVFEHLIEPKQELENMLTRSKSILFSTEIFLALPPQQDWWYYGFHHGQHIAFYSLNTLKYLAQVFNLNLYTNNTNIHLLTNQNINPLWFRFIVKNYKFIFPWIKWRSISKTHGDSIKFE